MNTASNASTHEPGGPLEADLELVLQGWQPPSGALQGRAWLDASEVAAALHEATAPAIAGIETVSIEAQRLTVEIAERTRAKLLLGRGPFPAGQVMPQAIHTASLGHVFDCQLILWVGTHGDAGAIERRIAREQLRAAFLKADLPTVQRLRRVHRDTPGAEPLGSCNRVTAVLSSDCDPRVATQWHRFAAEVQPHVRLAVIQLPSPDAMNRRGAIEVACWQTGLSLERGGIDFADGGPHRCPHLPDLLRAGAIDLLIDFGCDADLAVPDGVKHLRLPDDTLLTPARARVMRCDGVILWLKQPVAERDSVDATTAWLGDLRAALEADA